MSITNRWILYTFQSISFHFENKRLFMRTRKSESRDSVQGKLLLIVSKAEESTERTQIVQSQLQKCFCVVFKICLKFIYLCSIFIRFLNNDANHSFHHRLRGIFMSSSKYVYDEMQFHLWFKLCFLCGNWNDVLDANANDGVQIL